MELISVYNRRGLKLDGIYCDSGQRCVIVIHLHGSMGNFYHQDIVRECSSVFPKIGISFLSMNLSSHDCIAEGYERDGFRYIGGSVAEWPETYDDVSALVEFCEQQGYAQIVLQGHSLGCDRALYYLLGSKKRFPLVLLAQCDSNELQRRLRGDIDVHDQLKELSVAESPHTFYLLPPEWYGIEAGKESYAVPVSKKSLMSLMVGEAFKLVSLRNPTSFYIGSECFLYIGGRDPLQTWAPKEMMDYIRERVKSLSCAYVPEGDHELSSGVARDVARLVGEWIVSVGGSERAQKDR